MLPKKSIKEDRNGREIDYKISEKETCKVFLKEYNKKNKEDYHFISIGDPIKEEPSCICTDNLYIEITPVYYNKDEAKATWGLGKLFLIVEEGVGLTEKEAVEYYINQGKKFSNNIFGEIWLMLQLAGHHKIYLL